MEIKQKCDTCNQVGIFSNEKTIIIGEIPDFEMPIGQCPTCKKFYCAKHADKFIIEISREELLMYKENIIKTKELPFLLCCPFDLRTPLGNEAKKTKIIVFEQFEKKNKKSNLNINKYIKNPERYARKYSEFYFDNSKKGSKLHLLRNLFKNNKWL